MDLEERRQEVGLDDLVAVEVELAHPVAGALVDGDVELDPAGFLVGAVFKDLDLRLADARGDEALVPVILDNFFGVFLELRLLVLALAGHPRQKAVRLGTLHLASERAIAHFDIAVEVDAADLDLRPFLDVEHDLDHLGARRQRLDSRRHLRELVALLRHQVLDDALHALDHGLIEERVEAELNVELLHLLVDLGAFDLGGPGIVNDLHARPLFHVVDDVLAHYAIREWHVERFNPQVVEEVGGPQPLEVGEQRLLGLLVERHPHVVSGPAERGLDVIEIGLRFDLGRIDRVETQLGRANDRTRPGRRLTHWRRLGGSRRFRRNCLRILGSEGDRGEREKR